MTWKTVSKLYTENARFKAQAFPGLLTNPYMEVKKMLDKCSYHSWLWLVCSPSNRKTGWDLKKNTSSLETSQSAPQHPLESKLQAYRAPSLPSSPLSLSSRNTQTVHYPNHYTGRQKKFISIKHNLFKVLGLFFSRTLAIHLYCRDRVSAWQSATALHLSQLQSHTHAFLEAVFKNKTMSK